MSRNEADFWLIHQRMHRSQGHGETALNAKKQIVGTIAHVGRGKTSLTAAITRVLQGENPTQHPAQVFEDISGQEISDELRAYMDELVPVNKGHEPMSYPGPESEVGKARMKADAAMIDDPSRWPQGHMLHLKEQPWVKVDGRRYGTITMPDVMADRWRVTDKDTARDEEFASLEELVKVWSVD